MADNIEVGDLVARISFDDTGLNSSMAALNRQMQLVRTEFDSASSRLGAYANEQERLAAQQVSLTRQTQLQQQRINQLNEALQTSIRETGEGSAATQRLATQVNRAQTEYNRLNQQLVQTTNDLEEQRRETERTESAWGRLNDSLNRNSDKFKSVGATFSGIGTGIAGALGLAIKSAADAESQLAKMETALQGNTKEAENYLKWAEEFGKTTPFEAEDVVEATIKLKAYGLEAKQILGSVGNMAAGMGKGLDQAIEAVADAQTGELERLKEFGITKQMLIDKALALGKGEIVNAKGQITNQLALNDTLFSLMDERFKGGMERQSKTINGQVSALKDTISQSVQGIGAALLPVVTEIVGEIQKIADGFGSISPGMQSVIAVSAAVAAALSLVAGPLLLLIGFLPSIIAGFTALAPVLAALTGPIGLTVAAIAGLVTGISFLYNKNEDFRKFVNTTWESIKTSIVTAMQAVWTFLEPLIIDMVKFFKEQFAELQKFWESNGKAITTVVKTTFDFLVGYIKSQMAAIETVIRVAWDLIKVSIKVTLEAIKLVISTALDLIMGIISIWIKVFQGDWKGAWGVVKDTVKDVWGNIQTFLENINLIQIGKDIMSGLIKGIQSMASAVADQVKRIAKLIPDGIKDFLGIHSPSKVTEQLGKWTGQGLANGMDKTTSLVAQQAANLSAAAVPSMSKINGTSASVSGVTAASQSVSFEGMFSGANFVVRSDNDIKRIAQELYGMQRIAMRGAGIP